MHEGIDTLILGCTHYPHLKKILSEILGPGVALIDPAEETVSDVKMLLKNAGTLKTAPVQQKTEYFVTGPLIHFQEIGTKLLGRPIAHAHQIVLQ
jgi:glutamate racemase